MDMSIPHGSAAPCDSEALAELDRRVDRLQSGIGGVRAADAWRDFEVLHMDIARVVGPLRSRLLESGVAWSDDEKARAGWIHRVHLNFAALGRRLAEQLERKLGTSDARSLGAIATTLFYMGEVVKSEVAASTSAAHDYASLHALMRGVMASGHERRGMSVEVGGRRVTCTLETLYFRALLLARFASGTLSGRQVEVLDAWMFMWAPVLRGVAQAPDGSALRADLDSTGGLRRGARADGGPCLYLPHAPIALAFQGLLKELQSGHIVPPDGCTAGFRIEEHIAVLDLIRRGLRHSLEDNGMRAERHSANATVELFVGLGEITTRGYSNPCALPAEMEAGPRASVRRDPVDALASLYDKPRRMARLLNVSATGLALEGDGVECGAVSAGDIVGVRMAPDMPLELGKVMRCVASSTHGRTTIGVRRLSCAGRPATARDTSVEGASARLDMIFVAGDDESGRRDGWLVSEREYERRARLEAHLGDSVFAFRFNRMRERGRGWVLAGFEVEGVRASPVFSA